MKLKFLFIFILTLMLIQQSSAQEHNNSFALIELFTSEGCSSCPPADQFLIELAKQAKEKNQKIYTLGYHVNYWDYLGWKDPFAQPEFSERQSMYAQKLKDNTYTPQMIINGKYSLIGNNRSKAIDLIHQSLNQTPSCDLELSETVLTKDHPLFNLTFKVTNSPKEFLLNFAVIENNLTSDVLAGENTGRMLNHTNVVRILKTLDLDESSGEIPYPLWEEKKLTIIAFVQNKNNGEILCAQKIN